jgi:hypothetical protein
VPFFESEERSLLTGDGIEPHLDVVLVAPPALLDPFVAVLLPFVRHGAEENDGRRHRDGRLEHREEARVHVVGKALGQLVLEDRSARAPEYEHLAGLRTGGRSHPSRCLSEDRRGERQAQGQSDAGSKELPHDSATSRRSPYAGA